MSTSQPIQEAAIRQYARRLYLTTVADQFASLAEEAVRKKQSHLSYPKSGSSVRYQEGEKASKDDESAGVRSQSRKVIGTLN